MRDPRVKKLADIIVNYSCSLQKGENILIESIGGNEELVKDVIESAYAAGGKPYVKLDDTSIRRELLKGMTSEQLALMADLDSQLMRKMQAYVGIRGGDNTFELVDVNQDSMNAYQKEYWHKVHSLIRVPDTKWVVMRCPVPSMAQLAKMSNEAFEDYYFDVCTMDYAKMAKAVEPLRELMERTDRVRLTSGSGTDLTFSIKGIPAIPCVGTCNLPDGEIYTAPVKNSVNGVICYNTPSPKDGFVYENVRLTFKDGKIIDARSNDDARINKVFDTDEGARFVGEFAIGINPYITKPMGDILFDEKISGSIHFTPGCCYDEAPNGNKSAVHWDLVLIQTPEFGGGEIWFDGTLIRKDGLFVLDSLKGLNPENLKG